MKPFIYLKLKKSVLNIQLELKIVLIMLMINLVLLVNPDFIYKKTLVWKCQFQKEFPIVNIITKIKHVNNVILIFIFMKINV